MSRHFKIHHFDSIDSTQFEARKNIYGPGDIILSDIQTGGYGRRGREWQSPPGNLYCTLVEAFPDFSHLSWLGYAVGLALYEAVQPLLKQGELKLKWPNDLLIDGAKLSGLLLEVEEDKILIGMGMNIATLPETDQKATSLNDHMTEKQIPLNILERFLPHYNRWHAQGAQHGFAALRDTWLGRAAYRNMEITARLANGDVLTGVFNDIDKDGALVLHTQNRHYTLTAADIYLNKDNPEINKET